VNSRKSWLVFGVATFAYLVAVLQRSSFGVAGVEATDRFDVAAAALSTLAVVQLVVYAALQVPVGVTIDRVGPRFLLILGACLMFAGQIVLAVAPNLGVAIAGRALVGAGDAMTFISAIRLLSSWFSGKSLPIASQWLGTTGQVGQVLSTLPFAFALATWGWTPAFLGAAAMSVIAVVLLVVVLRSQDQKIHDDSGHHLPPLRQLKEALSRPGTQLGFWSHFVTQSSVTVVTMLWGFPFFSVALGYGHEGASWLLTYIVFVAAVSGPLLGILSARYPLRRSNLVIGIVISMAIAWGIVLAWPGQPPLWSIILMLTVISIGGPGSLIGFDYARTFNPTRAHGSATGVVNVGGFLASFVIVFLVGAVLDVIDRAHGGTGVPDELYSLDAFRVAFLSQYLVVGLGMVFLLSARRRTRRRLHEDEGIEVAPLWVSLVRAWRRRRNGATGATGDRPL
jgi:sugar phosphate permease